MKHTKLNLDELEIELKYSNFSSFSGNAEYHIVLNITNSFLSYQQQLENIYKALDYIQKKIISKSANLIWCRYFLSDPVNQYKYLNSGEDYAVSITGQAPLNNTKLVLWCYYIENSYPEKDKYCTQVNHSAYTHLYYTSLHHSIDAEEYDQTKGIFSVLKHSFQNQEITFRDHLIRTWIYVQGVDVHYKEMVTARKELFEQEGLTENTHYVASTGIEGRYIYPQTLVYMDAYAIKGLKQGQMGFLKALDYLSPTDKYGVTFERGTQIKFGDRNHIFISGTASIDKEGEIVAPHNILVQTQRTFENIGALLQEGNAGFQDVAHFIIYLRDTADYPAVNNYIESLYAEIPKVYVWAPVCRPGWLIEIECMAISPAENEHYAPF